MGAGAAVTTVCAATVGGRVRCHEDSEACAVSSQACSVAGCGHRKQTDGCQRHADRRAIFAPAPAGAGRSAALASVVAGAEAARQLEPPTTLQSPRSCASTQTVLQRAPLAARQAAGRRWQPSSVCDGATGNTAGLAGHGASLAVLVQRTRPRPWRPQTVVTAAAGAHGAQHGSAYRSTAASAAAGTQYHA